MFELFDRVLGVLTWVILKKRVTGVRGNGAGLGCGLGSVGLGGVINKYLDQDLGLVVLGR